MQRPAAGTLRSLAPRHCAASVAREVGLGRPMDARHATGPLAAPALLFFVAAAWVAASLLAGASLRAQDASSASGTADASSDSTDDGPRYLLRYKVRPGQQLKYSVEHLAEVETTIQGTTQKTHSRSVSTKVWEIHSAEAPDQVRLIYYVEDADMWSEVSGRKRVEYNSRSGEAPPPEYQGVAESIGRPLSTITMDLRGRVLHREDEIRQIDLGFGALAVPLPDEPVPIGYRWTSPYEVKVRLDDGTYKTIKVQQRYELRRVETGVATIELRTQVLTPVRDPKVEAQLVQRMSAGEIKFDIDAGRILAKELQWKESVVAFNGAESHMAYAARFREKLLDVDDHVARRASESTEK